MAFVPNTQDELKSMLDAIGVNDLEELLENVPENVMFKGDLNLPPKLSEFEALKHLKNLSQKNITAATHACYIGGGAYDHFVPSIVGSVLQKPEFKTAYTPYQAEVSQGTLQAMYEFQSMICEITGMEVSNASIYDGASSLAEACLMANAHNRKTEFLVAGTLNPNYQAVTDTVTIGRKLTFSTFTLPDGTCDLSALKAAMNENISAVIVQQPNFLGNIEDVIEIEKIAHAHKALFIVVVNPLSLGVLEAPGKYNADVVVAEGQVFGIPLSYGGPYLGIFACKQEFIRKLPGRIVGLTEDNKGNRAFTLTLQTREQQIKREKATSNICTNQGLFMLAATVYMETMGKQGIKEVANQSFSKAHYLADKINELPNFSLAIDKPFFNEFLINTPVPAGEIVDKAIESGILAGIDIQRFIAERKGLLIAVTEKRTKEEMDKFVEFLSKF